MKKFMTIAMIVLAAAMLVVSCDANKKADVDHSVLVNATIGLSEAKSLVKVTSASDAEIAAIKVTIAHQWKTLETEEAPYYGNLENPNHSAVKLTTSTDVTFNLGYISQGLWTVTVEAYANTSATDLVYNGEGTFFFTANADTHTVVLSESENSKTQQFRLGTITTPAYIDGTTYTLTVKIDDTPYTYTKATTPTDYIPLTTATDYSSAATYYDKDGNKITSATDAANWASYYVPNTSATDWTWTYTGTQPSLTVGSHSYEVVMTNSVEAKTTLGGVAGRFYIRHGNDTAYLSGDLAKSDFIVGSVQFKVDGYKVVIRDESNAQITTTKEVTYSTATDSNDNNVTQTLKADVTSEIGSVDNTKISWYLDGKVVAGAAGKTSYGFPLNTAPGYHHVTAMYDKKAYYEITIKVKPTASMNGNV